MADRQQIPIGVLDDNGTRVWEWDGREPYGYQLPNQDKDADSVLFYLNLRFPGQWFDQETGIYHNGFQRKRIHQENNRQTMKMKPILIIAVIMAILWFWEADTPQGHVYIHDISFNPTTNKLRFTGTAISSMLLPQRISVSKDNNIATVRIKMSFAKPFLRDKKYLSKTIDMDGINTLMLYDRETPILQRNPDTPVDPIKLMRDFPPVMEVSEEPIPKH